LKFERTACYKVNINADVERN